MNENKLIIKKHSAMIQISVKELTVVQRRLINSLIYIAQKMGNCSSYKTKVKILKDLCNITSVGNDNLKNSLIELNDIKIEFNYLNKDKNNVWEVTSLLSSARIVENINTVEFEFSNMLREKILNPAIYTPLDIFLISKLKSSYAIVLYEFLRDYITSPAIPRLEIKEIRDLLGIKDNEYKLFQNFKVNVIDFAVKEINEKSDINCSYQLIKEHGNKYSYIQFKATRNVENPANEETLDLFALSGSEDAADLKRVIMELPEKQRTDAVSKILSDYAEKGNDYIISNIKYTIKKSKDNFGAYLKQALENDYASHEREVKAKTVEEKAKKQQQIDQAEEVKRIAHNDYIKILNKIECLDSNKSKELQAKFKEMVKTKGIKKEFLTDPVSESLMVEAYRALYQANAYNAKDQD